MFGEFLNIIFKSIKLDKSLYSDSRNFGEASIYFAGLIMILDGMAGAVAANTVIKTAVAMSGLTAILTWFVWAIFIFVIGVKLFPDKQTKVSFKKVLTAVGFAHAPGLLRFFAITPDLMIPIIFLIFITHRIYPHNPFCLDINHPVDQISFHHNHHLLIE